MKKARVLKRLAALSMTAVMALSMFACTATGGGQNTQNPDNSENPSVEPNTQKSDETLVVALPAEPAGVTTLNGITNTQTNTVSYVIAPRLWELNTETNELEMSLATGFEKIDDTHYRVTLREDAVYADGTPITAADVAYTFTCAAEVGLDYARNLDPANFVVEDDHNIILAYTQYTPGWNVALAEANAGIYSEAAVEAVGGVQAAERQAPVGGGRYNFVEWKSGEYILVERNENYWDEDYVGYYKYIKFIWATDSASRMLAVKSGDADVALDINISEAITLQNDPTAKAWVSGASTVYNVYFNCTDTVFADAKLREACMYLIDSESVNNLVNMGYGNAVQGFIPEQNPYYVEYYEGGVHPYDPEKGKQLVEEAGYAGTTIECLVLTTNASIATMIQEMLRVGGIEMNIQQVEPSTYVTESRAGNYDLTIGNNSNGFISPDNFVLLDPDRVYTTIGGPKITDPVMTELIAKATSPDEATAKEGWADIINYIFDNNCLVGLCDRVLCAAINPELDGLQQIKRDQVDVTEVRPAG